MADQKISQLSSIGAVDNAADLFPIVDTSAAETKKITPSALKTALALNNVDNTSDLGKPVSTATQTALDGKQDALGFTAENVANKSTSVVTDQASSAKYPTVKAVYDWAVATFQAAIGYTPANKAGETFTGPISATNLSGTNTGDNAVNSLYSGLAASKEDVANKSTSVTTDQASNTKYPSVKSVYDWVSAAFQATLVSGTNIKTINSTSLLGSGDITISASPSGVSGAIQFSNGSAFASDAAKFFWDNTNKRLGIGTNTPASALDVNGTADGVTAIRFKSQFSAFGTLWSDNTQVGICRNFRGTGGNACLSLGAVGVGVRNGGDHTAVATLDIKGSGSTSATTSLLVQNSAGSNALQVRDDRVIIMAGLPTSSSGLPSGALWNNSGVLNVA
jgi:hypothetical protein